MGAIDTADRMTQAVTEAASECNSADGLKTHEDRPRAHLNVKRVVGYRGGVVGGGLGTPNVIFRV
jgi:hypothetical protein